VASLQTIQRRIRSVRSTRQITKAMQLVAASKLRRAQTAALGPQAYTAAARELLANLSGQPVVKRHPLMVARPVKRELSILIAGDRGMAGGYNSNVVRALGRHLRETPGAEHSAIAIGRRAATSLARAKDVKVLASFDIEAHDAVTGIAAPVLEQVVTLFEGGNIDAVHLITTDFVSTVTQHVNVRQLLPVVVPAKTAPKGDAEMEPEPEELVDFAIQRVLEAELVQAILEARASEQAARMLAMMSATDNADDIISDLTLVYNNERQSSITQEISEITAGSEAIANA
jgi:F-type H+-transporting ATPase subunit gamma